jgi:hypothetical protein
MSYKDGGAKQTQDDRDHFDHFDAPGDTLLVRVIGDPGFRPASSGPEKWFRSDSRSKSAIAKQRARVVRRQRSARIK